MFSRKRKRLAEALEGLFELGLPEKRWYTHREVFEMTDTEIRFDMYKKRPFLIDYLRHSLFLGGFPGLEKEQLADPAVEALLVHLTRDFVPF